MKKKTFLNATVAGAAVLFLAGLAHAQLAEVPFYAGNLIKPNVMIMLDTSGSMEWDVNCCQSNNYYGSGCPKTGTCSPKYLGSNRIQIAKHVLTGSGEIPIQYKGYNVYMGDSKGTLSVRNYVTKPFTRILRINDAYQPDAKGAYFVFADSDDLGFGDFSNTPPAVINNCQGGNCPSSKNMDTALTTLDQYLWERKMFQLNQIDRLDITDGGVSKQRDIYSAVATDGSLAPRDAFVQHYWDIQRTVRVFPVVRVTNCYSGNPCYRPDASGSRFVFFDGIDYDVSVSDPDAQLWAVDLLLRDYLASKGTSSYSFVENLNVCGDSTLSACPGDGRNSNRAIYRWVANGTAGATVFVNRNPTEAEVRTALVGSIPKVTLTDVMNPVDGRYGPDFTFAIPPPELAQSLDFAVRMGLEIPQPTSSDPLNYINSAFTYVNKGVTYHFFDGKDANGDGKFDGLTYGQQFYEVDPGLLDIYTNIRWGLAKFDNGGSPTGTTCVGSNSDFSGCGADLLISLPDEYSDGTSADTARNAVQTQIIGMSVSGYTPLADSMRNMYDYFFAPARKADRPTDTNPTMYVDHKCDGTPTDHIVQLDAAYTSFTTEGNRGCRRNFVIFVTDGDQTMGLGCTQAEANARYCTQTLVRDYQQYWVTQLKHGGDIWQGVKVFVIGFALQGNDRALAQLAGMAAASKMGPDDPYDYAFWANDEEELKATLATIFNIIMSGAYTRSAPILNPKETAIVAGYFVVNPDKVMWEGHLELYDLTLLENPDDLGGLMPVADGASVLNKTNSDDRDIFTAQPVSGLDNWAYYEGALKQWNKIDFVTSRASDLLTLLRPGSQDGDTALNEVEDARVLIDFIRGTAQDSPQVTFTNKDARTWTLGAINRSVPVIVGPPGGKAEESFRKYEFFLEKYENRPSLTYVGANDGMLHAFFMDDLKENNPPRQMEEAFAYIPYEVLPTLRLLRENQWYYVDGSPVAADVFLPQPLWMADVQWDDTTKRAAAGCDEVGGERFCWRTMLVCGLGQGGRDYFALDVTDADSTSASKTGTPAAEKIHTLWEFTDRYAVAGETDPRDRLGDTWSRPFLAELKLGDGDSTWVAAVFGGGQSAEDDYPDIGNYIYFVNADDASILRRFMVPDKDDPNWWNKVEAGLWNDDPTRTLSGDSLKYFASQNNLPSDPTVVDAPPQEGLSELLYMGDLQGRMWKVNMASGDTAEWELGLLWDTGDREGEYADEKDLPPPGSTLAYTEFDALRRPIFYAPTVIEAPESGLLVIFGTGHIEDKVMARDETMVNYIFAVWDKDPVIKIGTEDVTSYGTLWSETQREEHCPGCIGDITYPFALEPGEKIIAKPKVDEGVLKFQTFIPFSNNPCASSFNPCKPGLVRSWYVDYLTFQPIYNLPGGGGRYLELEDFTTSRFTSGNKGDYYMVPPGGISLTPTPPSKDSDILSWGEGISFDW